MEAAYAVVTAVGEDRVGIVDDLSALVAEQGCNIEESRMAALGGEFAVVMLVSGRAEALESLGRAAPARGPELRLRVETRLTRAPSRHGAGRPYVLESVSLDAPGIVHSVAEVLRKFGANIEDMDTETASAPWTGAPMFRMRAHIVVPQGVVVAELRHELESLELVRDLDISLKPAAPTREG
jgi:glycine cleavage system transcriptional repressor